MRIPAFALLVLAHHSFAMFDTQHPIEITGTVKEFRWVSPHTVLILEVKGQDGTVRNWTLEGDTPSLLRTQGVTATSLRAGDEVVARIERYDPTKPVGPGQEAPLTPEYQAIFQANLDEVAKGGIGDDPVYRCIPEGMPRAMNLTFPMEIVIKRDTTYMLMENPSNLRRIYTDGREFPNDESPSWMGYSIGKWIDEDGDGRNDVLEIETRNLKNPRTFDSSGLPLHKDAQTVVRERLFLDKSDSDILHDQITTYDHALTRPWSVMKTMRRQPKAVWVETICSENNLHVKIGNEIYMLNDAGELMPMKKDQPPPDLKYFRGPAR